MTTPDHPRRIRLGKLSLAERAIHQAQMAVEEMPPDPRLTEATILLGQAQTKVADFIGDVPAVASAPTDASRALIEIGRERDEWADAIRSVAPGYIPTPAAAKSAILELRRELREAMLKNAELREKADANKSANVLTRAELIGVCARGSLNLGYSDTARFALKALSCELGRK